MIQLPSLFNTSDVSTVDAIRSLPTECYYLQTDGRVYESIDDIVGDSENSHKLVQLHFRHFGGKGGFGSLLRSFRTRKSTNQLMCRDLNGRRLADVKEEERLRRWVEKKAERDKEAERKKQEKYERLQNKTKTKHDFQDQDYLRKRDLILDQTEDALEAGFKALQEKELEGGDVLPEAKKEKTPEEEENDTTEESSDSDVDLDALLPGPSIKQKAKKRKTPIVMPKVEELAVKGEEETAAKKPKKEEPSQKIAAKKEEKPTEKVTKEEIKKEDNVKEKDKPKEKKASPVVKDFPPVDLEQIESAADLEQLGLDHLKHALEARGLKCGGALKERASRLFSVKDLQPDAYPKNIRAKAK